jgi:tetratricopeptide (TPR) repeat protein
VGILDKLKGLGRAATAPSESDAVRAWRRLSERRPVDRSSLQAMSQEAISELIQDAQGHYLQALYADESGSRDAARKHYIAATTLLPTHIEALDNLGITLVEDLRFSDAIPYLEQSAVAEPRSPLAYVYLVKCYQEAGRHRDAFEMAQYLAFHWPDKSPVVDWSHLGKPTSAVPLKADPFTPGQVWHYADTSSSVGTLWIRAVDLHFADTLILHISIPNSSRGFVSHLPFTWKSVQASVKQLTTDTQDWDRPDDRFGWGYHTWREAYKAGEAGVFDIPVADVLEELLGAPPSLGDRG